MDKRDESRRGIEGTRGPAPPTAPVPPPTEEEVLAARQAEIEALRRALLGVEVTEKARPRRP